MTHFFNRFGLFCLLTLPLLSHASGSVQAQSTVAKAMQESLDIINTPQLSSAAKRQQLWPVITRYFDFDSIATLTLGKFSATASTPLGQYSDRRFTPVQQREFTRLFTTHLGNIYLDKLNDDSRFTVAILQSMPLKAVKDMPRARVNTQINAKTNIDYSLRYKHKEWRIYDIRVEGRSLISSFRKEYNALLLKQTPAQLLKQLREKNVAHEQNRTVQ